LPRDSFAVKKKLIEVVSKPQIRFKGPPKADYISDLKRLRYVSSVRPIEKGVVPSIHG
jgi:hypothetical protein